VLASFYALGVVGLSVMQAMPAGAQAGLSHFILGQAATMRAEDAWAAGLLALFCLASTVALFPRLRALCFDAEFAALQGLNIRRTDAALMGLILLVCIAGLPAVGLVLVVALLVLPAATARLLNRRLPGMFMASAALGGVCGVLGALLSAGHAGWPTGAAVVLVGAAFFIAALLLRRT
ncbi:MAG: metal ABC transporter permease, partial [Alphaproteobacteria bacterium]|nr:metal ABC transporter permease [Alphaproteobacteria bacterium]